MESLNIKHYRNIEDGKQKWVRLPPTGESEYITS